jgi:hypothetical protein
VQAYTVFVGESVTDDHPAAAWVAERFSVLRDQIADAARVVLGERRNGAAGLDRDVDAVARHVAASL